MGANKPIEDIEATLLAATKSALLVRLRKIVGVGTGPNAKKTISLPIDVIR